MDTKQKPLKSKLREITPSQWHVQILHNTIEENVPQTKEGKTHSNRYENTEHQINKTRKESPMKSVLKAGGEKPQVTYKGKSIRITADFSVETLKAIWAWSNAFLVLKDCDSQYRKIYQGKLSAVIEGERKGFRSINILIISDKSSQRKIQEIWFPAEVRSEHSNRPVERNMKPYLLKQSTAQNTNTTENQQHEDSS